MGAQPHDAARRGRQPDEEHRDRALARLAGRQDGVVARGQLVALGFTRRSVGRRLANGTLIALYRGVYAVGHAAIGERGRMRAALLAVGADAVLSHASAARAWGLAPRAADPVELTVVGRQVRSRPDLVVHGALSLAPDDVRRVDGLLATSPARTLLDLASRTSPEVLERAIAEARVRRLVRDGDLVAAIARAPRQHAGAGPLRQALSARGAEPTRSELERVFLRLVEQAGLPRPLVNRRHGPHLLDFEWPEHGVIVETDGWAAHGTRHAFEADRARDAQRQASGLAVLRFTWRQVTEKPLRVIAQVAQIIALRGPHGRADRRCTSASRGPRRRAICR
jgi:very-short-patch-repair endonuclease